MANPRGRVFPHVDAAKRKDFDTGQSLHLLWTRLFEFQEGVDTSNATIQQQAATIQDLTSQISDLKTRVLTTTPPQGTAPAATGGAPGGGGGGTPPPGVPDLFPDIVAARAAYGATMTNDECVALINSVALANAGNGFGLLLKTTGNRGSQPTTGTQVSVDIIYHLPTNSLWDALFDAGHITAGPGAAKPEWLFVAVLTGTTRFVAPV